MALPAAGPPAMRAPLALPVGMAGMHIQSLRPAGVDGAEAAGARVGRMSVPFGHGWLVPLPALIMGLHNRGEMAEERERAPARPRRPAEVPSRFGKTSVHPLGRLGLAGNQAITGLIERRLSVQRAPGDPPATVTPVYGGTGANGTVSLYHYGDLTTGTEFISTRGYPRLTNCDIATSQKDAPRTPAQR
jgi:hypothetical protein